MKIGIDIRTLMDAQYSGVPEYTLNLVGGILSQDNTNEYVLFYNSFKDLDNHIPKFEGENVRVAKTNYPNKIFNYALQIGLKTPKIDELLGVDLFFMPHMNFASLGSSSKKIITIHDLSFLRYPHFFSIRKNIWHQIINVRNLVSQFDIIVAVSENTKRDLMELCLVPEDKIRVIYSGVDNKFKKINISLNQKKELQKKYRLPEKFILYLGTIEPRKNVDGIIRSYDIFRDKDKHNNTKLVIAGADGWKSGNIYKTWRQSPYKNDIIFLGYIDANDKVFLYNMASLFVYISFYEGFGFPPLEALACGVPVITSNISSLPEVSGHNALFVDPYKINEISHAISLILNRKIQENNNLEINNKILDRFSWKSAIDKYLYLFKS